MVLMQPQCEPPHPSFMQAGAQQTLSRRLRSG
jgi:hypothetical protein